MSSIRMLGACFVGETPVRTDEGMDGSGRRSMAIEHLRVGCEVLSRCETTGKTVSRRVSGYCERYAQISGIRCSLGPALREVSGAMCEEMLTTAEALFWVCDRGWTLLRELQPGDRLDTCDGEGVVVESVRIDFMKEFVYGLDVEGLHTYFVGRAGVWVHSAGGWSLGNGPSHPRGTSPAAVSMGSGQAQGGAAMPGEQLTARIRKMLRYHGT